MEIMDKRRGEIARIYKEKHGKEPTEAEAEEIARDIYELAQLAVEAAQEKFTKRKNGETSVAGT